MNSVRFCDCVFHFVFCLRSWDFVIGNLVSSFRVVALRCISEIYQFAYRKLRCVTFTSSRFWHAHLNHACMRATSPLAGAGTTDNMAGDQLAVWNQVNARSNEPIPSTHLTIFVPPALGAFILANLKSPKGDPPQLRPVTPSQPHSSSVLTASRPFHLDLPLVFPDNEDIIMDNARQAAAAGFIRPESIPLLAITDESFSMESLAGRYAFRCHRQSPPALLVDSLPRSHFNKVPIALRH